MPQISIDALPSAWPHDGRLEPSETALLIIDMQRDFCDEGGYIASMGYDVSPARRSFPMCAGSAMLSPHGADRSC